MHPEAISTLQVRSRESELTGLVFLWTVAFMALCALADLPIQISFGQFSALAAITVTFFLTGVALATVLAVRQPCPLRVIWPFRAFALFMAASLLWTTAIISGLQNSLVSAAMLVFMSISASEARLNPSYVRLIERLVHAGTVFACMIYTVSLVLYGFGSNEFIGARGFGLFVLPGIALHLARWRYGSLKSLFWALSFTILLSASLSRLALGIAVVLFLLSQWSAKSFRTVLRNVLLLVAVVATVYGALTYFDALRERFVTGDISLHLGDVGINVSGRINFWKVASESFFESPWLGKGVGSTEALIEAYFVDIRHPHNDYIRIAHDLGIVGLALWAIAIVTLLTKLFRNWRRADRFSTPHRSFQLFALLLALSYTLEMTMENAMVYIFVCGPLGLVVGTALGNAESEVAAKRSESLRRFALRKT